MSEISEGFILREKYRRPYSIAIDSENCTKPYNTLPLRIKCKPQTFPTIVRGIFSNILTRAIQMDSDGRPRTVSQDNINQFIDMNMKDLDLALADGQITTQGGFRFYLDKHESNNFELRIFDNFGRNFLAKPETREEFIKIVEPGVNNPNQ
jgi:hypothetical protein